MTTYGIMQDRIANEIARSNLASEIRDAIQSAIRHYQGERFWFNENAAVFVTSAGQEYYGAAAHADIPNIIEMDAAKATVNGTDVAIAPRDFAHIDAVRASLSHRGAPTDYVIYNQQIRLYPVPDASYTCTFAYVRLLGTVSQTASTNAWFIEGEELIRSHAKRDLFRHVIRDFDEAAAMREAEIESLVRLRTETERRIATGRLRLSGA